MFVIVAIKSLITVVVSYVVVVVVDRSRQCVEVRPFPLVYQVYNCFNFEHFEQIGFLMEEKTLH